LILIGSQRVSCLRSTVLTPILVRFVVLVSCVTCSALYKYNVVNVSLPTPNYGLTGGTLFSTIPFFRWSKTAPSAIGQNAQLMNPHTPPNRISPNVDVTIGWIIL